MNESNPLKASSFAGFALYAFLPPHKPELEAIDKTKSLKMVFTKY